MARKTNGEDRTPTEKARAINENDLKALMRVCRNGAKEIGTVNGSVREKIAYAKEHSNLHTGAFSVFRKLDKMEPEELALLWDHLEHMMEVGGLNERIKSVVSMDLKQPEEPDDGKVSRPRFGDRAEPTPAA